MAPIDFLFLGSSGVWTSVNARLIEEEMKRLTGKPISIENFGYTFLGMDLDYLLLKAAIKNREVKRLFLGMPPRQQELPHPAVKYLWDPMDFYGEMKLSYYLKNYAEKILQSFPTILKKIIGFKNTEFVFLEDTNGSMVAPLGFVDNPSRLGDPKTFQKVDIASVRIQNVESKNVVINGNFSSYQMYYLRKIISLIREHKVEAYFYIPPVMPPVVEISKVRSLEQMSGYELPLFSAKLETIFPGKSEDEVRKFFYNVMHLNANGSKHFSMSIIPNLLKLYNSNEASREGSVHPADSNNER